ncbi:MmpS family transport accessory protein [Micromonospora sp. NPDC048999]|uniref:MmpS family transport accessory protein n=1 Tax=Micromonospora sp. NPDC048999 TaxID=3155391 RepID=UPI0033E5A64E
MSEATPPPEPPASGGSTDPAAPPPPAPWTPPDPLAAPQPWTPPTPWTPTPWSPPDTPVGLGTPGAYENPAPNESPGQSDAYPPAGAPTYPPAGAPTYPPAGAAPPPGQAWPGHPAPAWPPQGYPPPYAYPGAPPARTNGGRTVAIVVGVVAALLALLCCGCVGLGLLDDLTAEPVASGEPYPDFGVPDEPNVTTAQDSPATAPSDGPGELTVVYEVGGTDTVDLQFYDANADFFEVDEVRTPWRMTFTANDRERVQVLAAPIGSGDATCRITINGKVVSENSGRWWVACFGW